jgi:hypothetical protein
MKTKLYLAMAVVVAVASMSMQATVLVQNMPVVETALLNFNSSSASYYAVGFSTPAGLAYNLTSVKIDASGAPALNIYNNSVGNQPGTLFASLTSPGGVANIWTFTGTATFAPSSTYWAVVSGSGTWYGNDANYAQGGAVGAYVGRSISSFPINTWGAFAGNSPSLQVDVTAVPEPGE